MDPTLIGAIIEAIATVAGAVFGFIGGGIITLKVTRQHEQEKEIQHILEELERIKNSLRDNRDAFDRLKKDKGEYEEMIYQGDSWLFTITFHLGFTRTVGCGS
jgi:hypothetical protein